MASMLINYALFRARERLSSGPAGAPCRAARVSLDALSHDEYRMGIASDSFTSIRGMVCENNEYPAIWRVVW